MTALLLAPHHDDETLFASFLCLKYKPRVVICTTPKVQEPEVYAEEREAETAAVMDLFGLEWHQLSFLDTDDGIHHALKHYLELHQEFGDEAPDVVIAPAYEDGGQPQHNLVALAATDVYGDSVIQYLTYTRDGRSRGGTLHEPEDPDWIGLKLQALSLYRSQLRVPNCRPWFYNALDMREWLA